MSESQQAFFVSNRTWYEDGGTIDLTNLRETVTNSLFTEDSSQSVVVILL